MSKAKMFWTVISLVMIAGGAWSRDIYVEVLGVATYLPWIND